LGFFAFMAWIIPDKVSVAFMSWIAKRGNFSLIGLLIGLISLVVVLVMTVIAVVKLWYLIQMPQWVSISLWAGLGLSVISLVILIIYWTKHKKTS